MELGGHIQAGRVCSFDYLYEKITTTKNIRIVFEMFARDKYSHSSVGGRKLLLGHLLTLPDNKSVEDVHQPLRLSSKGNMNKRLCPGTIQSVIESSGVLEQRGVPTPSAINKAYW